MPQIKYPEMTKKTSTPTKPPGKPGNAGVIEQHGNDGERAQTIDIGAVFHQSNLIRTVGKLRRSRLAAAMRFARRRRGN